jgi:hypothetical protein
VLGLVIEYISLRKLYYLLKRLSRYIIKTFRKQEKVSRTKEK